MSKGNINYKYLRRRKSWFRRNLDLILVYAGIGVLCVVVVLVVLMKVLGFGFFATKKDSNGNGNAGENVTVQQETTAPREVVWHEDKEPESTEVSYTPPEDAKYPYYIMVNRAANCVTVYGIDASGEYTIPVKAFACSCGSETTKTIIGTDFATSDKYAWRLMEDKLYGQYVDRIYDGYLFQSVPYASEDKSTLQTEEFNKLGSAATSGCIRLSVRDMKWIYDNCPQYTRVTIYDDAENPGALGKPETIKIPLDSANAGWDPTDPDEANPWRSSSAKLSGVGDITCKIGEEVNLKKGVTATDTCGNDITSKIITIGKYTFDKTGEYSITYKVTDAIGSTDTKTVKLIVTE
jgi:lipoprotein-anchoring transpeptidase ErfK/SrfK